MSKLDADQRFLAAIAYGEASTKNDPQEIEAIAWAAANRARMWGNITISTMLKKDPNYSFAISDGNQRFARLMAAKEDAILEDAGIKAAVEAAGRALAGKATDLAAGGIFWDGLDFKTNPKHAKRLLCFKYGSPAHNIFGIAEATRELVIHWRVKNIKTGKVVDGKERGRYDHVYVSTAAHGSTIIWMYNPAYLTATGAKAHR
jgi:hypothetical protein